MKKKTDNKRPSKGERLKWAPLSKITPIVLTQDMVKGEKIDPKEYTMRKLTNQLFL